VKTIARRDELARTITPDYVLSTLAEEWFSHYAVLPSMAAETFVTLWSAHTHYRKDDGTLAHKVTPRAWLLSSEPGSGKSLLLELMALVSHNVKSIEIEPTAPGLKMIIGNEKSGAYLDEGDILFGAGKRKEDVRAILNAGYSAVGLGGSVTNGIGGGPNRTRIFGEVALAGLDTLETATDDKLVALLSRGIKIRMVKVSKERARAMPKLETEMVIGTAEADAEAGRNALAWVASSTYDAVIGNRDVALFAYDILPKELDPRAAQIWGPLARIAVAVGGEWPGRVKDAAAELSLKHANDSALSGFRSSFGSRS
jgi:hypothetical protein